MKSYGLCVTVSNSVSAYCHKLENKDSGEVKTRITISLFVPLLNEAFFYSMPIVERSNTSLVKVEASIL